jgi:chromosome segregation ATPase
LERAEADRDYWRTQATTAQEKLEAVSGELHSVQIEEARLSGELEGLKHERDGLVTVDQRYQAQLQRLETQAERLQTRIDSLEDERSRLTQELMNLYRRLAATEPNPNTAANGDSKPAPEGR